MKSNSIIVKAWDRIIKKKHIVVLYFLLCVFVFFLFSRKIDFHLDELLTYNLANDTEWLSPENGIQFSPANKPYVDAMAATGTFDLSHVWSQQAGDTHPPFYYVLVHAICTLFPGSMSMRYAALVNLVFIVLSFYFYRKIVDLLIEDETIKYVLSLCFVFSVGILSITTLLRMYVMTMFWITLFAYYIIKKIEKYTLSDVALLCVITMCGALTHYYFIVFAFFISLMIGIILIVERRLREVIEYIVAMAVAGGASVAIFPAMLVHFFGNMRGTQSISNLQSSDIVEQAIDFFSIISNEIFGGLLGLIVIVLVGIFLIFRNPQTGIIAGEQKPSMNITRADKHRYICLLIPSVLFLLFVAKSTPYNTDRYISPIYVVALSGVLCLTYRFLQAFCSNKRNCYFIFMTFLAIMIFCGFSGYGWEYLYRDHKEQLVNAANYGRGTNAICVYDESWAINESYLYIGECDTSTFFNITDYASLAEKMDESMFGDRVAFFLIGFEDEEEFIDKFEADYPNYKLSLDNGRCGRGNCYYFDRQ